MSLKSKFNIEEDKRGWERETRMNVNKCSYKYLSLLKLGMKEGVKKQTFQERRLGEGTGIKSGNTACIFMA